MPTNVTTVLFGGQRWLNEKKAGKGGKEKEKEKEKGEGSGRGRGSGVEWNEW